MMALTGDEDIPQKKVVLPKALHDLEKVGDLPKKQERWNTNEEIAFWLTRFDKHYQWLASTVKIRAESGSMFLYNRKKVKYRNDGYLWKKRKDCKTTREDHMKLKIKGVDCLYGNYVHSAIIPTFHRRCYWLLQNPDIILVHYLNVPVTEDRKLTLESLTNGSLIDLPQHDGTNWSTEDLIKQITPMLHGYQIQLNGSQELTPSASAEVIAQYLLHGHRQNNSDSRNCSCLDCTTLRIMAQVPPSPASSCSSHTTSVASTSQGSIHHSDNNIKSCSNQNTLSNAISNKVKMDDSGNINLLIVVANQNNAGNNKLQVKSIAPVDSSQNISEVLKGLGNVQCVTDVTSNGWGSSEGNVDSSRIGMNGVNGQLQNHSGMSSPMTSRGHLESPSVSQGTVPLAAHQSQCYDLHGSHFHQNTNSMNHIPSGIHQGTGPQISLQQTLQEQQRHSGGQPFRQGSLHPAGQGTQTSLPQASHQGRSILRSPQLIVSSPQLIPNQEAHQVPQLLSTGTQQCNPFNLSRETMESIRLGNQIKSTSHSPATSAHSVHTVQEPGTFKMPGFSLPAENRPLGSPQLILQQVPSNSSTKPPQFILKASESKAGEIPKFILKPAEGTVAMTAQGLASPQFILKAVTSGDSGNPHLVLASPQTSNNATIHTKESYLNNLMSQSESNPSLLQMVADANIVAAETRNSFDGRSNFPSDIQSNSQQSDVTWVGQIENHSQTSQGISNAHSGQLKITGQESQELRELVNGDPKLKTLENRFKDHRSNLVMLPERVQEHYLHRQTDARTSNEEKTPQNFGTGGSHQGSTSNASQSEMQGTSNDKADPTHLSQKGQVHQSRSPSRVDMTYQHSVNSSNIYCQNEHSDFPTLSEFNAMDQDGNFSPNDQNSVLSDLLSASSSFHNSMGLAESGHDFTKSGSATSDLGSLPSPSNIELDFDTFELMESPLPELGAALLASSSPNPSLGDFNHGANQEQPVPQHNSHDARPRDAGDEDHSGEHLCEITDFSPDWSYTEGGVKILVTGPWHSTQDVYSCIFDQTNVPAALVQTGVLRCYSPAHEAGKCALHVTCNGVLISKPLMFEYRARTNQYVAGSHDWLSLDENRFKMAILERLEQMEQRLGTKGNQGRSQPPGSTQSVSFEDRIFGICQDLMRQRPPTSVPQIQTVSRPDHGMTLLHLAAALGFSRLISTLFLWRRDHNSIAAELELDPMNMDNASCTPLMWACALGHMESALLLYRWRPHCLKMSDSLGRLPLDVAKSRGHTSLADSLVQLSQEEPHLWSPLDASPSPKSDPIQIPQSGRNVLPAFMVSSPATNTPSSSLSDDSAPIFEAQSPSSGCLSNLSGSPVSQGLVTPNMGASPQMSPRLQDLPGTSSGSLGNMLNVQQGFLRRDSGVSVKSSTSPHHHHGQSHTHHLSSSPQFPAGGIPMPIPPPISQATLKAFLSGSQILGNLDPAELMGLHPLGDREHADQKEMWESFVKELQVAAQQQEDQGDGVLGEEEQRCDSPMQTDDYMPLLMPRSAAGNKEQYLSLAEHILDALPDRIKLEGSREGSRGSVAGSQVESEGPHVQVDQESLHDSIGSIASPFSSPGGVEDALYRPSIDSSPASSYSGAESSCRASSSPSNISFDEDFPPADWSEFLQGSGHALQWAFSILTLSDEEQRQLYKAAIVIQNAFRQYKGRQQQKQQELEAAVIIQSYYRRYKEYFHYKSMSEAARVIQNKFRSFQSYRQFQRSRKAAIIIQNSYRTYRAQEQFRKSRDAAILIQQRFRDKRKARMKREQEAARKIQRFLRRYHNRVISQKKRQGNRMKQGTT